MKFSKLRNKLPPLSDNSSSNSWRSSSRDSTPRASPSASASRSHSLSPSPRLSNALAPLTPSRSPSTSSPEVAASRVELEAVFRFMDTNGDGRVSLEELQTVLRSLGNDHSEEELRGMIQEVDFDGDGFISLDEFLAFNAASAASLAELRAAFHVFDLDRNGYISSDELHKVMLAVGEKSTSRDDCLRMIRGVDRDGDGQVDFEEFKVMMVSGSIPVSSS